MCVGEISHTVTGMSNERVIPAAEAVVLNLSRNESMAGGAGPVSPDALNRHVVLKLRDPLGIAVGMAESIPELVDDLRRLSAGSSAWSEVAAVLDEMARTADLIKSNITRALDLVEQDSLPASQRS